MADSGGAVAHPLFARLYALLSKHEPAELAQYRRALLAGLSGRVLDLGAGAGPNFGHYPPEVEEVLAVEPEPYLRRRAADAAADAGVPISVVDGTADALPVEDGSLDAAVACFVLCSVPSQATALRELRRALRPGGELRFHEHVVAERPGQARAQRFIDRTFWPPMNGGCRTARDTAAAIEAAGFAIERCERVVLAPMRGLNPTAGQIHGVARAPA